MPLDFQRARPFLQAGNLTKLFVEELGWEPARQKLMLRAGETDFAFTAVAEKRGFTAWLCASADGKLPDHATRLKLDRKLSETSFEHLIVFATHDYATQSWMWVRREQGKPLAARTHEFNRTQPGDSLLQKLQILYVSLEEEEAGLSVTEIASRARAAFDIERVTKAFYRDFDTHRKAFLKFIDGIGEVADCEWYASVMLNRLMFVYFIQRKGFLDGDRDYLRNRLQRCQQEHGKDKFYTFYRIFLLRLFHEGFGRRRKDRAPDLEKLLGNIPYLNGGLFDVHELEKPERYGEVIQIPDKAFERVFDYFDQYQWHLDERPLRADNEINPDVLGYIFEKYINQKQMGAYYTKEDITEYISKNTVLPFLFDAAKKACRVAFEGSSSRREEAHSKSGARESQSLVTSAATPTIWDLLRENPDRYIYDAVKKGVEIPLPKMIEAGINDVSKRGGWNKPAPSEFALPTEIWREVVARRQRYFELRARLIGGTTALTPAQANSLTRPAATLSHPMGEGQERENRSPSLGKSSASFSPDAGCHSPSPPSEGGEGRGEVGRPPPITDINDFITLNLDLRQFAQDVIENCEGPDLLMAFWQAITTITVLDPTGGSGAFIFAALNILEPLYEACLDRMEAFLAEWNVSSPSPLEERAGERRPKQLHPNYHKKFTEVLARVDAHPNRRYFVLKSITLNNLYAVDIMEEAVEICKLRLFLKLAAQVEPDATKDNLGIEPLPDIDFNIRAGNTLVGYATKEEVQRCMKELGGGQMKLMGEEELGSFTRFNTRCADVEQAFSKFRQLQTEGDGSVPAADKQELQKRLKALEDELNRHLATEYGVKVSDKAAFTKWVKSHQPFHWFIQFYGILASGGFDVIIGNPPYVEMNKVNEYRITNYKTLDSGNLYALCVERSGVLLCGVGYMGVIVPLSGFSTERMLSYQELVWSRFNSLALSFYSGDAHPSVLFDGVKYRLCVIIAAKTKADRRDVRVSDYLRWYADERPTLFAAKVAHTPCHFSSGFLRFAKTGTRLAEQVASKLLAKKPTLATYLRRSGKGHITYHRSPVFWIRSMDFEPFFKSPVKDRSTDHLKDLFFQDSIQAQKAGAFLNSSLFYFWFTAQGNCRNIAGPDIETFPVGDLDDAKLKGLTKVFAELMADLKRHSKRRVYVYEASGKVEYDEFYPDQSKPILDEIDTVLAGHYGFTAAELDFILNYDIKYRLGRATDPEED